MKYLDLFSGAGGFRAAFEQIPGTKCVGHCEIDPHADKSYRALFNTEGEWFCNDARQIDTGQLPDFDLVCGGFPCQSNAEEMVIPKKLARGCKSIDTPHFL